jgi:hypothetical protein
MDEQPISDDEQADKSYVQALADRLREGILSGEITPGMDPELDEQLRRLLAELNKFLGPEGRKDKEVSS